MTSANLIQSATRDVLWRGLVSAALIVGVFAIAIATAGAEPAPGIGGHEPTATHRAVTTGQGRPAGCPRLWCGCWSRLQEGLPPRFNLAMAWLSLRHVPKQVGAYAVMRRRGGGHVGRVVAIDAAGNPVILSGNHGGRVGVGTYPAGRVLAYVRPN